MMQASTMPPARVADSAAAHRLPMEMKGENMEYRLLGETGFKVPVLSLGTGTFGGSNDFFKAWGSTDADGARRLVDIALEAGVSMFDSADVYSDGMAEEILGKAIAGRRSQVIVSTKGTFQFGSDVNSVGSTRQPEAPEHRLHRHLSAAWFRRAYTRGRNLAYPRRLRTRRQDSCNRLFKFLRLALDEIAGGVGP
jgi:aryl-alcohol dehydrogenase-like predicted oxidoreductase